MADFLNGPALVHPKAEKGDRQHPGADDVDRVADLIAMRVGGYGVGRTVMMPDDSHRYAVMLGKGHGHPSADGLEVGRPPARAKTPRPAPLR